MLVACAKAELILSFREMLQKKGDLCYDKSERGETIGEYQ